MDLKRLFLGGEAEPTTPEAMPPLDPGAAGGDCPPVATEGGRVVAYHPTDRHPRRRHEGADAGIIHGPGGVPAVGHTLAYRIPLPPEDTAARAAAEPESNDQAAE